MSKFAGCLWCFLFLWPAYSFAQNKNSVNRARTVRDEVSVFKEANFDSQIIATLPNEGQIYDISSKRFNGAFYRIRVKPGLLGYVSDADIKPLAAGAQKKNIADTKKKDVKPPAENKKNRSFQFTQYSGFQYALIQFQEDTMGDKRQENLGFFGAKVSGPNLVIEGAMPTEMNFLFHYGAPGYYEKLTGKTADGWILLMDLLLENYYPQGKNALAFFGFGPMLRYSKFNTSVTDQSTGKTTDYSLEDISIGAVINAGVALRFKQMALRGELQYYWEKLPYLGASVALQFAF